MASEISDNGAQAILYFSTRRCFCCAYASPFGSGRLWPFVLPKFAGDVNSERRQLGPLHENWRSHARSKKSSCREKQARDQGCQIQYIEKYPTVPKRHHTRFIALMHRPGRRSHRHLLVQNHTNQGWGCTLKGLCNNVFTVRKYRLERIPDVNDL